MTVQIDQFGSIRYKHSRRGDPWKGNDGWGKILHGTQDDDFIYRNGYAFPKAFGSTAGEVRTPEESSYGYGCHVYRGEVKVFKGLQYSSDYDDRLRQSYPGKWEEARAALTAGLPGGAVSYATVPQENLDGFLSVLYGHRVTCVQVLRGTNASSGYPYYIFITERVGE
jgi:hypothetical protein